MPQVSDRNFGLLIAYIVPGFATLVGLGPFSKTIQLWLSYSTADQLPTIAGFLYVTVASVGLGMAVSAIRYATIDQIHERTGLSRPKWDDAKLQQKYDAFLMLVEHHYRYYQFHSNSIVAAIIVIVAHLLGGSPMTEWAVFILPVIAIFWVTARSNLQRYYERTTTLLSTKGRKK